MYIDSPNISGSLNITGSLLLNGTAVTASGGGGGSGAGFPFSGSAVITGSLYVSGGNLSGSFAGDGSGLTNVTATIDQYATVNDTFTNVPSHSVVHNFGTKDVFVQVFEDDDTLLIPYKVTTTDINTVDIEFGDTLSGRVVIGKAGHILQNTGNFVSSSTAVATFTNAMSASINHNLDSLNVITQVYDSNNNVIVPSNIKNTSSNQTLITFSTSRSGKAVIAKAGHIISGTAAVSASLATTAERVRAGDSGSRPTDYVNISTGSLWYNTNTLALEAFTGVSGSWWQPIGSASTSQYAAQPYDVDYLVTAGGGGGAGTYVGAGGGAGGLRTSYGSTSGGGTSAESDLTLTPNVVYNITVGAGGAGGPVAGSNGQGSTGTSGNDSSVQGTGITTITSIAGGGAGAYNGGSGLTGGSGGGGAHNTSTDNGGDGTSGQGYDGGRGGTGPPYSGGGGGAAAIGGAASAGSSDGGNGLAVNILSTANATTSAVGEVNSSNVYFAGGGAGANYVGATPNTTGTGGLGGGGDQSTSYAQGDAGAANTGGGGAASERGSSGDTKYAGGAGGSGVVILRMSTSNYSGTYTGSSVDVYTEGLNTVVVFKTSGTYTA